MHYEESKTINNSFCLNKNNSVPEKQKNIEGIYNIIVNKPGAIDIELVLEYGRKLAADDSSNLTEPKFALLLLLASSLPNKASVEKSLEALHLACNLIKGGKVRLIAIILLN